MSTTATVILIVAGAVIAVVVLYLLSVSGRSGGVEAKGPGFKIGARIDEETAGVSLDDVEVGRDMNLRSAGPAKIEKTKVGRDLELDVGERQAGQ